MIENYKFIISMLAATIGLLTFIKALIEYRDHNIEYRKHNMLNRIQLYLHMRGKYARDPVIQKVCTALGSADDSLISELVYHEKRLFLGTMETLALMVESGVVNPSIAMYMFGYYAIAAWDSPKFWGEGNLNKDDPIWSLFKKFVDDMKKIRIEFESNPKKIISENFKF